MKTQRLILVLGCISMKRGCQVIFPPEENNKMYLTLKTSETEITFAYENHQKEELDAMLGKLVSPIYGSIIQVDMRNWRGYQSQHDVLIIQ